MEKLKLSASKHCRACLQSSGYQMYSLALKDELFENNSQTHAEYVNLAEIYNLCTQMLYEQTNPNWELICQNCFGKLIEFFEFRKMCIDSYNKIKEIESLNSRQLDDCRLAIDVGFKVEVVDVAHILEPDTIASGGDHFDHENSTSNLSEKTEILLGDSEANGDKVDETTTYKTRSSRSQTCIEEYDRINDHSTTENLDTENRNYDDDHDDDDDDDDEDDDDYDVNDDEDGSKEDDEDHTTNVKDEINLSDARGKTKNSTITKKSTSKEWDHVCDICSKKFFKKHRYDAHMRKHLGLKQWKCDHCESAFEKYTSLKLHIMANHSEGEKPVFRCDVDGCGKSYAMKQTLRVHIQKVHEGKKPIVYTRICEQCGKSFNSNAALVRHAYTHTKETPFKCDVCTRMFSTNCRLKEHKMRHDGIKNFVCPTCGLRKTTKRELRIHMKYHNEDIQFPCKLCSVVFTRQENMKRHMKVVHLGVKAFPCPHCDQSFGKSETLKHHVMTHTGEKPFACPICDKRFIQKVALKTHMKTHNKTK